ncbi:uncharacterized protein NECHADRAFT_97412 [Fusarium vanettenii 77-13-4]|uniref:Uncharacterized protein n=1 Tax=Fusarium vanettenii (strain ATCC MYA-4622 / CBS 123669 / FGSC 9596 / NRRL 45880 / 77-13-4) TaxID=660122 RepID=C7ZI45_FUSV7|nr:uncharacterized protein NECHADRAFT_97412 [Fusarium vanettenii 77-13-4]EEU36379.1 hypothetical protein NECHADRAFT_97412 [Fusarium vanettenii 77-13-4]
MAETAPIPIILCGKTEGIGRAVIAALKPEIEVVHFVLAGESGQTIIPPLLAGESPPSHPESSTIGSGNYAQVPRAILLGGAFDEGTIATLRDAVKATSGARKIPWILQDLTLPAPPVGTPEYSALMTKRSKDALLKLDQDGKLDGSHDGIEWY